jgi:hypothetical protein
VSLTAPSLELSASAVFEARISKAAPPDIKIRFMQTGVSHQKEKRSRSYNNFY